MFKHIRRIPYFYLLTIPILIYCLGCVSNQLVCVANHGKFPVAVTDYDYEKMCAGPSERRADNWCGNGGQFLDAEHSIMGPNSHLKVLSDIFPIDDRIYSIGDGLIYLGDTTIPYGIAIWIALAIRKLTAIN